MKDELLQLMYQIFVLNVFLEAINKAVGLDSSPDDQRRSDVRLSGNIEGHPQEVQQAVSKWMREMNCPLSDVPIILAAEAYIAHLAGELERSFYRDKAGIIVAEGNFRWLVERLTDDYHNETRLTDHLHVELFTQLPGMVRRARRVRPLILEREVPLALDRRYHEAVKSYLSGHAIACCVLCRAVVETALKNALERRTGEQVSLDYRTLGQLIDDAERLRLLPPEILKHCRSVKRFGDTAAPPRQATDIGRGVPDPRRFPEGATSRFCWRVPRGPRAHRLTRGDLSSDSAVHKTGARVARPRLVTAGVTRK